MTETTVDRLFNTLAAQHPRMMLLALASTQLQRHESLSDLLASSVLTTPPESLRRPDVSERELAAFWNNRTARQAFYGLDTMSSIRAVAPLDGLKEHFDIQLQGPSALAPGLLRAALQFIGNESSSVELGWTLVLHGRFQRFVHPQQYPGPHLPASLRAGLFLLLLAGVDPVRFGLGTSLQPPTIPYSLIWNELVRFLPRDLSAEEILALPVAIQSAALLQQILRLTWTPDARLPGILALAQRRCDLPVLQGGLQREERLWLRQLELNDWLASNPMPLPKANGDAHPILDQLYQAAAELLRADRAELTSRLSAMVRDFGKATELKDPDLPGLPGVLQLLVLAAVGGNDAQRQLARLGKVRGWAAPLIQDARVWLDAIEQGQRPALPNLEFHDPHASRVFLRAVFHYWSGTPLPPTLVDSCRRLLPELDRLGWNWMARSMRVALGEPGEAVAPLVWRQPQRPWERTLTALAQIAGIKDGQTVGRYPCLRVEVFPQNLIRPDRPPSYAAVTLQVRERTPTAKGGYSSGRLIPPRIAREVAARLAPEDHAGREFLGCWERMPSEELAIDADDELLTALVGLDGVEVRFGRADPEADTVELCKPALQLERLESGAVRVQLDPAPLGEGSHFRLDTARRTLVVVRFDARARALAASIRDSDVLPPEAVPQLAALAPQLERQLPIHGRAALASRQVAPVDTRLHVLVHPLPSGLRFQLRTRPLGPGGVFCVPGHGATELFGLLDGEPVLTRRDLAQERKAAEDLQQELAALAGLELHEGLELSDPEQALELLEQLQGRDQPEALRLPMHWPEKPVRLTPVRSAQRLRLKLGGQRDWLAAEGDLTLDDGEVIGLARLLDALPSTHGRFVQLGDSRVLALSQQLARQLRQLKLLREGSGQTVKLPWLASAMLDPLLAEAGEVESSAAFRDRLGRIREAMTLDPTLPAGFGADLRDYQREGVRWLQRLAHWAPGACLADDMGLGKTVQALAVLQSRAALGPQLVVAPTSVVGNWQREASRFTPGLEVKIYAEGDRSGTLAGLAPGSLLLLSYGLLAQDIESLQRTRFATVVYDEAQALKNPQTLRAQAARQLQADFSIATTGTPIENHLGELWSLFRLVAPGLLGSQEQFSRRFAGPIASDPTSSARSTLRSLIAPFILRRNKHEVLDELPSRTEVVLRVEADAAEARLQQALRKQALDRLQDDAEDENRRRFNILAALTRLRRAACHPNLAAPELGLPGSKLNQLLELVDELREGRHRALVFSQFTDFLAIVRQALDQRGLKYQYLDGQSAPKARQQAVDAFQAGEGELFLLSLKAGGVGLNLTAADYVIHLDPWWNPAIEQQATDRAHRIGQTRPVTVYKLVLAGSIEEQILALHGSKRELVDAMLAEQDGGSRLGLEDLLGLLRGVES